jgi:hypothetical protein
MEINQEIAKAAEKVTEIIHLSEIISQYRPRWDEQIVKIKNCDSPNEKTNRIIHLLNCIQFKAAGKDLESAIKFCQDTFVGREPPTTLTGLLAAYFYTHNLFNRVTSADLNNNLELIIKASRLGTEYPSKSEQAKAMAKDIAARLDPDHIWGPSDLVFVLESSLINAKDLMKAHELRCKNGELL